MKKIKKEFEEFIQTGMKIYKKIEKLQGKERVVEFLAFQRIKRELEMFAFSLGIWKNKKGGE